MLTALCLITSFSLAAQVDSLYEESFLKIDSLLKEANVKSFKMAVFIVENAFWSGRLSYPEYDSHILMLTSFVNQVRKQNKLKDEYKRNYTDLRKIELGAALFSVMKDTTPIEYGDELILHLPMTYDFEDIFGEDNWTNMFVTKLLATHKGNCHSLPYLYKILANEIGLDAHLAIAPNHVYIKTHSQQYGWFNIELTSGTFPMDAWLMASTYVTLDAIRSGIYMKALDERESIALCLVDLANGFERKYPEHDGKFVMKCTDLALQYFPTCINALLLQAELKKRQLTAHMLELGVSELVDARDNSKLSDDFMEMESRYAKIIELGYRQMPKQMYINWLMSIDQEKDKYENKKLNEKH